MSFFCYSLMMDSSFSTAILPLSLLCCLIRDMIFSSSSLSVSGTNPLIPKVGLNIGLEFVISGYSSILGAAVMTILGMSCCSVFGSLSSEELYLEEFEEDDEDCSISKLVTPITGVPHLCPIYGSSTTREPIFLICEG